MSTVSSNDRNAPMLHIINYCSVIPVEMKLEMVDQSNLSILSMHITCRSLKFLFDRHKKGLMFCVSKFSLVISLNHRSFYQMLSF